MNQAHLHIVLVHLPIVAFPLLTMLYLFGLKWKSDQLVKAAAIFIGLLAILTIPAYLAGEGAEEIVEHISEVSEDAIEAHEEAGLYAFIAVLISGLFASLLLAREYLGKSCSRLKQLLVPLLLLASALLIWTGNLGGKIRHTEILKDKTAELTHNK